MYNFNEIGLGKNFQNQLLNIREEHQRILDENNAIDAKIKSKCSIEQLIHIEKAEAKKWSVLSFNTKTGDVKLDHKLNNQKMTISKCGKMIRK
tara:strand:+ start:318 stop:596 length:279 start_codon:yes stop_codon:yes gene_type:complete